MLAFSEQTGCSPTIGLADVQVGGPDSMKMRSREGIPDRSEHKRSQVIGSEPSHGSSDRNQKQNCS